MQVRVGGYYLGAIGSWGDLKWSSRWGGGSFEASWSMDLPVGFQHPAITRGQLVVVEDSGWPVWRGLLNEPDRSEWSFVAAGLHREADYYGALDGSGNSTSTPDTAIDAAIARGLPWTRTASISSSAFTSATDNINTLTDLLDAYAEQQGQRWFVDADGVVGMAADTTTPVWHLTPGSADLGVADDDYASHIFLRYLRSSDFTYQTATASDSAAAAAWGHREFLADATSLGGITTTKANNLAAGILSQGKARLGWTNGIEATAFELLNAGGVKADLTAVSAGQMVRIHGLGDDVRDLSGRQFIDVVASEVTYTDGEPTIQLSPQGLAPRTLASVTERQVSAATQSGYKA